MNLTHEGQPSLDVLDLDSSALKRDYEFYGGYHIPIYDVALHINGYMSLGAPTDKKKGTAFASVHRKHMDIRTSDQGYVEVLIPEGSINTSEFFLSRRIGHTARWSNVSRDVRYPTTIVAESALLRLGADVYNKGLTYLFLPHMYENRLNQISYQQGGEVFLVPNDFMNPSDNIQLALRLEQLIAKGDASAVMEISKIANQLRDTAMNLDSRLKRKYNESSRQKKH